MSPTSVIVHAQLQSGFDWAGLVGGILSGAVSGFLAYLALKRDNEKDEIRKKVDQLDGVQTLLQLIVTGIERLSDAYSDPGIECMVDTIKTLNDAFLIRLQKLMPRFVGTSNELKIFFIQLWDDAIDERDRYAKPIQEHNQGMLWDKSTQGVAKQTIAAELEILVKAYNDLSSIQKRLIDEVRPRGMRTNKEYETVPKHTS